MSWIAEYYKAIDSGEITACKDIQAVYKHLYDKVQGKIIDGYAYKPENGQRFIDFMETFCILPTTNHTAKLMLWQKALADAMFSFVDDNGLRQYTEVFCMLGRKNGKSAFAGGVALYLMLCDGESEPQVACCANSQKQAKLLWQTAVDIIRKSPELRAITKTHIGDITCPANGGIFQPLSAEKKAMDGLNLHGAFLDEQHAQQTSDIYDLMVDATAAREQPLTMIISTNGFVRDAFFDNKIKEYERIIRGYSDSSYVDDRRLPILYRLDDKVEWTNPDCWIKSNPSLGVVRDKQKLAEDVARAKEDEIKRKDIMVKFFNMPESAISKFLSFEEVNIKEVVNLEDFRDCYYIAGFDLSKINDLTSTCIMLKRPGDNRLYIHSMSWMPQDQLEANIKTGIPYDIWLKKEFVRLSTDNRQINHLDILSWFNELRDEYNLIPYRIGYDPWSSKPLIDAVEKQYGRICMPIRQGAKTLNFPLQLMKEKFKQRNIVFNNECLKWCLTNLEVMQDINANLNTVKNRHDKLARDDAAIALLNALAVYYSEQENFEALIEK